MINFMSVNKVIKTIKENDSFLFFSHLSPDGDALGSTIALGIALEKLNKKVSYNLDPTIGNKFKFLPDLEKPSEINNQNRWDIALCLDCSDLNHLYGSESLRFCKKTINIDHHINNKAYGDINFIEPKASATGEIVYTIIKLLNIELDKDIATALYTAIVTDTGTFKYSNVTSKTHFIISELLKLPIEAWRINKELFDEHPKEKIFLLGRAINNLQLYFDNKVAIISLDTNDFKETGATPEKTDGIINYGRDISGVEVAITVIEIKNNEYKIGFRSNEYVDVAKIAFDLGGGGHVRASGCTMTGNKEYIINKLKDIISKEIY